MAKLIFITGGSASGKTTIAQSMKDSLGDSATLISQDMFYLPTLSNKTNYDIPSAFDWDLQKQVMKNLKDGKETKIPEYSFETHNRVGEHNVDATDVIIFEGLFTFWEKELLELADFKIYVDTPSDTRLIRRLLRDVKERGRDPLDIVDRWQKDVQPSFTKYINPVKRDADIIIPWVTVKEKTISAILSIVQGI